MSWAGLDAESVRMRNEGSPAKPMELGVSVLGGAIGFGFASLAVFGSVALAERELYRALGLAGAYLVWTGLFMGLGGVLLGRLVTGRGNLWRFTGVFSLGFALYGAGWCLGWFGVRGFPGEVLGTLLGAALLHGVLVSAFARIGLFFRTLLPVLGANLAGYFIGEGVWRALEHSRTGMTLWGVVYGLWVGAGIGWLLHRLQLSTGATEGRPAD
jgi:hypothetical protein